MLDRPSLKEIAEQIPLGFECRGCGGSAYNWLSNCARYVKTGEGCCANFRVWIAKAKAGEPTWEEKRRARIALSAPRPTEGNGREDGADG